MTKTGKIILGVIVVLILIWIASSMSKSGGVSSETIKIGFVGPLTGDAANIGQNAKSAVEVAVDEINKDGGVGGKTLSVIYEDGKCGGKDAANAANKLINVDKVPVIIGGACSGETSAFTGVAEQTKTVVLSYCSSAPNITTAGDYIFRNYPSDTYQGAFAANYINSVLGKSKVAIVYVKTDWGVGVKDVFKDKFASLGGTIVSEDGYEQTAKDFRTQLTKIKVLSPDIIYFLGYTEASVPALRQARDLGINTPMFGADAWDDSKIWTEAGAAGEGAMYTLVSANPSNAFKTALATKVGSNEVGPCSPTAYDATKIIAEIISDVGTDTSKIKDALYKADYTDGVSSKEIKFDANGDIVGANYAVKQVHNGAAAEVK